MILVFTALNTVTLNQFSKLPLLVVHYIDHWQRNHEVSIADFLDMHYGGHDINDKDDEQDKQLPLKSFSPTAIHAYTVPENESFVLSPPFFSIVKNTPLVRSLFFPKQVASCLFRPPRALA